jgi:hypothetical protein
MHIVGLQISSWPINAQLVHKGPSIRIRKSIFLMIFKVPKAAKNLKIAFTLPYTTWPRWREQGGGLCSLPLCSSHFWCNFLKLFQQIWNLCELLRFIYFLYFILAQNVINHGACYVNKAFCFIPCTILHSHPRLSILILNYNHYTIYIVSHTNVKSCILSTSLIPYLGRQ